MSIETILNTCRVHMCMHMHTHMHALTHTHTHRHLHTDYTKLNLHNLKRAANRNLRRMKTAARNGKYGRSLILAKRLSLQNLGHNVSPVRDAPLHHRRVITLK